MDTDKIIIGSEEWCSFLSLGIPAIKARVDSGAKTSCIHAYNIEPFTKNNQSWIRFELSPLQGDGKTVLSCEMPVHDRRLIKSSNGRSEKRYVVKVTLGLGEHSWEIEITLTNRDSMGYRMLLGREAISDKALIDSSRSFCLREYTDSELKQLYKIQEPNNNGLKIGLLASNPSLYSNQRIIEAGEQLGHEIEFFNVKHCFMKLNAASPAVNYRGGRNLNHLDAIIPRIRPAMTFYGCALIRQFESLDILTLNTASSITQSRDKLFSLQKLFKGGVEIPTTGFADSPLETDDLIDMVGGAPLILKLLEGTQGTGVILAETSKAAESVIGAFKSLKANFLVQEFIKEAQGKDLRLFVINGRVVAAIERSAAPGEFRANLHRGGSAKAIIPNKEERQIAIKAAKIFNLDVAGVDIIRSSRGPLLLEVNSSPGLEGVEAATEKDIAGFMIKAIEKKLKWDKANCSPKDKGLPAKSDRVGG